MTLTYKVDHFTVFDRLPSTSCCLLKFLPNKIENVASCNWTSEEVSGMLTLGGWWGMVC